MPLFDKVIAESSDQPADLKDVLARKMRDKKMAEMDETTIERQVQAERTKTAELEARQTEAEVRKTTAELSVADKLIPQGMWAVIGELLKDRNPNQPMTVQDFLAVMEYAQAQQGGGGQEGPPDGMWGFLTAIMSNMHNNNQTTTPMELIQLIQTVSAMGHQQQAPASPTNQLLEMVQAFGALKGLFSSPAPQVAPGTSLAMPGGGAIPLEDFMKYMDHNFNLQMKGEEFRNKMENAKTVREQAPGAIAAITEIAQALRSGGIKNEQKQVKDTPVRKDQMLPPPPVPDGMQMLGCPDCHLQFAVPADLDLNKVDVTCPQCAVVALKIREEENVRKHKEADGQEQGDGQQVEDTGGYFDNPQE